MVRTKNKVDRKFTLYAKPLYFDKLNDLYEIQIFIWAL